MTCHLVVSFDLQYATILSLYNPIYVYMAMGQNLWYHIWVDEHPFTSYLDVHQGYRVLTHNHMGKAIQ